MSYFYENRGYFYKYVTKSRIGEDKPRFLPKPTGAIPSCVYARDQPSAGFGEGFVPSVRGTNTSRPLTIR